MTVGTICTRHVFSVDGDTDITQAARQMREWHVGFLVVTTQRNSRAVPIGVLTDRDVVLEVVAQEVAPATVAVKDIMSPDPLLAHENDPLHETLLKMRAAGVRRVPVQDAGGTLVGVLSLDDVVGFLNQMIQDLAGAISREQSVEQRLRA